MHPFMGLIGRLVAVRIVYSHLVVKQSVSCQRHTVQQCHDRAILNWCRSCQKPREFIVRKWLGFSVVRIANSALPHWTDVHDILTLQELDIAKSSLILHDRLDLRARQAAKDAVIGDFWNVTLLDHGSFVGFNDVAKLCFSLPPSGWTFPKPQLNFKGNIVLHKFQTAMPIF